MQTVVTFFLPDGLALTRPIHPGDVIGRDPDLPLTLAHGSVSRRHARFDRAADGTWTIVDLGSKNGLRIDGRRVAQAELAPGRWFVIGDVYARFDSLTPEQSERLAADRQMRRTASQTMRAALVGTGRDPVRLDRALAAFVELAGCRRGFVLRDRGRDGLVVASVFRMRDAVGHDDRFDGSTGVVARCRSERRPIFVSSLPDAAWLKNRASIVAGGVRALVCLPLLDGVDLLGVVYADTDEGERVFDELDAELLGAFAEDIATWLALQSLDAKVAALDARLAQRGGEP